MYEELLFTIDYLFRDQNYHVEAHWLLHRLQSQHIKGRNSASKLNSMFTATILITIALAHTQLYTPKPKFYIQVTANFPSAECSQITYTNNNPAANIVMFTAQLQSKFAGSLLAYFSACGSNSPKTDHNAQAPIPADGHVKIQADSQHPSYYEFYIDDTKVAGGTWQEGQTPETFPIDFSKCAGTCKFRYMMAAVHQQPIQLYDNIVTLTAGTGSEAIILSDNGSGNGNANAI